MSVPLGKGVGERDGKNEHPMFKVSENSRATHAISLCRRLLLLITPVCSCCHHTSFHLSFSLKQETHTRLNVNTSLEKIVTFGMFKKNP